MMLAELPVRVVIEGRVIESRQHDNTRTAKQRASDAYYQRNQERLKAKALERWRRINGKA